MTWNDPFMSERVKNSKKVLDFWQSMISRWFFEITIPDWLMQKFRYQTLVQSQSRDLGLLRKQLEQSRLTTHKLRGIIEDLTRSDQLIDQRRFIQLARRTIRKLEGELKEKIWQTWRYLKMSSVVNIFFSSKCVDVKNSSLRNTYFMATIFWKYILLMWN